MRSCLEYSSPVYHPQLNQYQKNQLEKVQKRSLRLIYGYDKTYEELLRESGITSLEDRCTLQYNKFTENAQKTPKYKHWFPPNNNLRSGWHTNKYLEETSLGNRLYKSPIYAMRRYLNRTEDTLSTDLVWIV